MKTIIGKPIDISILKGTKRSDFLRQNQISKKVAQKFLKSSDKKKIKNCIICNSKKIKLVSKVLDIEFMQCSNCLHVFNKYRYSEKFLKTFWKRDGDIIAVHTHGKQQSYRSKNLSEPKIKQVLDLTNKAPKKINWLDMGCGNGEFLISAKKKGVKVYGFDLNERDIKLAKKKGIKAFQTNLQGFYENYYDNKIKFDVISSTGYFDMIDYPIKEMQILEKMTKQGTIFMLDVPDFNSITHEMIKTFPEKSIRHLNACQRSSFTSKSALYLLRKFNYKPMLRWYYGLDFYMILNFLKQQTNKFEKTKVFEIMTNRYSDFQKIFDQEKSSDTIFIIAKKNKR